MIKDHTRKRHFAKAVTWRLVGTIDTILISWVISGNPFTGLKIGVSEVLTKMVLYYLHERVWFKINLTKDGKLLESRKRHLGKTITWRMVGTLDTILLAWLISGNPMTGLKIGFTEVLTKMVFYYIHERLWHRSKFGLAHKNNDVTS